MRVESDDAAGHRLAKETLRWVAGTLLLLFLGVPLCLYLMLPLGMSGDGCGAGNITLLCSAAVQLTVIYLPWLGLLLGLATCLVGGLRRLSRGDTPVRAVLAGWAVFVVFEAVLLLVVH
jgi:hypothetical protein